jgi:hypothetical protein
MYDKELALEILSQNHKRPNIIFHSYSKFHFYFLRQKSGIE